MKYYIFLKIIKFFPHSFLIWYLQLNRVIEYFLAYIIPAALLLLVTTYVIFIGKLYSLDFFIKFSRLDPFPEMKTHEFFFTISRELDKLTLFLSLEIEPIS